MNIFLDTALVILGIALVINTILAFFIYRHNSTSATNLIFVFLSIVTSLWLFIMYRTIQPTFFSEILLYTRLAVFFAVPQSVLFFLLAHTLPSDTLLIKKRFLALTILSSSFIMLLTLSPYVFRDIQIIDGSPKQLIGPAMPLFAAFVSFFSIAAVYVLIKKIRRSTDIRKQQLRFVLAGILLMLSLIIGTIMLPVVLFQNDTFVQFSPLYVLIFLGMTAYAIFKHQLFNIKVLATEALTFVLLTVTIFDMLFARDLGILIFKISVFLLVLSFGILLIRSVRKEVEQREKLESLTKELEVANRELKRLDAAKSEFVSIASHQLRTPLTASKGYLSLILEGTYGVISKKLQKPISNVYHSNERLIQLVNDLLNLSRLESGKMKLELEETNIGETIKSVIEELKVKAEQKNIQLVFKEPVPALLTLQLDKEKIRNVILNLIDNAIRYTEEGSITVKLKIKNLKLKIEVTDTGEGMTQEEIAKLFESFSRGEAGEKLSTEGAGLGLYIAKQFVQMHKGKIWATSAGKGKGSTFLVELPIT